MLKRIYIDNYKCLTNFEYHPGKLQLLLGRNGSGKSTVFEVLGLLRRLLVDGESVSIFSPNSRTRWQDRVEQTLELDVALGDRNYTYRLVVEHQSEAPHTRRVSHEELRLNGRTVFCAEDVVWEEEPEPGPLVATFDGDEQPFLVDDERSALPLVATRAAVRPFQEWVARLHCTQVNPCEMSSASSEEAPHPTRDLSNYASWYRHISQERPRVASALLEYLEPVLPGFAGFALTKEGETARVLRAEIRSDSRGRERYRFDELSDGQRALAGLYTLLALMKDTPTTLCIDEPDNFLALPEIQPWLLELHDVTEEHGSQALIISHHPELINYLAPRDAVLFSRVPEGPVRVAPFAPESDEPLTASEIIARGWEEHAPSE